MLPLYFNSIQGKDKEIIILGRTSLLILLDFTLLYFFTSFDRNEVTAHVFLTTALCQHRRSFHLPERLPCLRHHLCCHLPTDGLSAFFGVSVKNASVNALACLSEYINALFLLSAFNKLGMKLMLLMISG